MRERGSPAARKPRYQRPTRNRLWTFVNTGFGLWLLSAIFIYGTGASFALWHQRSEKQAASRATIARLDIEISYRFAQIFAILQRMEAQRRELALYKAMRDRKSLDTFANQVDPLTKEVFQFSATKLFEIPGLDDELAIAETRVRDSIAKTYVDPTILVTSPPGHYYQPLHPEYKAYNLAALIIALRGYVPDSERMDLDIVLHQVAPFTSPSDAVLVASRLRRVSLDRWRKQPFHLAECGEADPLCINKAPYDQPSRYSPKTMESWIGYRPQFMLRVLSFDNLLRTRPYFGRERDEIRQAIERRPSFE